MTEKPLTTTQALTQLTKECRPIIKEYWDEYNDILNECNSVNYGISTPNHNDKTIQLIYKLKKMATWRSNLFILYLHYKKVRILANMLKVNKASLSVYLTQIKKDLRN